LRLGTAPRGGQLEAFPDLVAMKPDQTPIRIAALQRGRAPGGGRFRPARFLRDRRAGAAVEFALVLLPFLMVLMTMINSALVLLAGQVLQTAATTAGRLILTGQAQTANFTAAQFKNSICASLTVMFNCSSNLYIDVESLPPGSSFSSITLPGATNANGTVNSGGFNYNPGSPGYIVIVRLIYQWPIIAPGLSIGLVNSANSTNTLIATVAFVNEPYASGP
jgi:Flp pilus assembly protein TadG